MIYNQNGSTLHSLDGKRGGKEQKLNSANLQQNSVLPSIHLYIYIYIYLSKYVYTYLFVHVNINIYIYVCVSVCDVRATASDQRE